jgi:hypothetical protein
MDIDEYKYDRKKPTPADWQRQANRFYQKERIWEDKFEGVSEAHSMDWSLTSANAYGKMTLITNPNIAWEKIFLIGLNKTASVTIHNYFEHLGIKSLHGGRWSEYFTEYAGFSDGASIQSIKDAYTYCPDALFILNTRYLDSWILSRTKHCCIENAAWGWPPSTEVYIKWIKEREKHFNFVLDFFVNKPSNLWVLSIERDNWEKWLYENLNTSLDGYIDIKLNTAHKKPPIPSKLLELMSDELTKAFDVLGYSPEQRRMEFLQDNSKVAIYKNNLSIS